MNNEKFDRQEFLEKYLREHPWRRPCDGKSGYCQQKTDIVSWIEFRLYSSAANAFGLPRCALCPLYTGGLEEFGHVYSHDEKRQTSIMINDWYQTLGVSKTATPQQISEAYIEKAKRYHPRTMQELNDSDSPNNEMMKQINQARDFFQDIFGKSKV